MKSNLATGLNTRLNRSETAITLASEIRASLVFCSRYANWNCLHTTATSSLSSGDQYIDYPANFKALDLIYLNDGTNDKRPLELMEFERWQKRRYDETSANYDEPKRYADRGKKIYLDPLPDDTGYTYYLRHWRIHPDQDTILFQDAFEEAILNALMGYYQRRFGPEMAESSMFYFDVAAVELIALKPIFEDRKILTVRQGI